MREQIKKEHAVLRNTASFYTIADTLTWPASNGSIIPFFVAIRRIQRSDLILTGRLSSE